MFERLDAEARRAIETACSMARELGHGWLGTEHVLVGLLETASLPADARSLLPDAMDVRRRLIEGLRPDPARRSERDLLAELGIDLDEVRRRAVRTFGVDAVERAAGRVRGDPRSHRRRRRRRCERRRGCATVLPGGSLTMAPRLKRAVEAVARRGAQQGGPVTPVMLLAAVLSIHDGLAAELLGWMGVDVAAVRALLER